MLADPLFALDIGTRNVVGLVARQDGDRLIVVASGIEAHEERAMRDGQIHDIPKVVRAVVALKERLEQEFGAPLKRCAIAAAGRSLQTMRAKAHKEVGLAQTITPERVRALELSAIQDACAQLSTEDYHCVGYSVVHYFLDGQPLANLEGQRGKIIEVELIATFLPRVVTDSLVAVCHQSGLSVQNLTLEPIAAINAAVPANMRALNLALIDIGAGTSDIALTQGGTIMAYAMVPAAGDAITEAIAEAYLLDFLEAERVKYALSHDQALSFMDVLGLEHTFSAEAVRQMVRPVVEELIAKIAQSILSLNGKPPAAAILIGGGSLYPGFAPLLSQALGMNENRVAVRGTEMVKRLTSVPPLLEGPMGVTPVGIALAALEAPGFRFLTVYMEDQVLNIEDWGSARVVDAVLAAGYDLAAFAPGPVATIEIRINGKQHTLPAQPATQSRLMMDGEITQTDAPLLDGARLQVLKPKPGQESIPLMASDVVSLAPVRVTINGLSMDFPPVVRVNGTAIGSDRPLRDGDSLDLDCSVKALMGQAGLAEPPLSDLNFWLNDEERVVPLRQLRIAVNGQQASLETEIKGGELVEVAQQLFAHPTITDVLPAEVFTLGLRVNDKPHTLTNPAIEVLMGGEPVPLDTPVPTGARLRYRYAKPMTVADVLLLLESQLDGCESDDLLITVDGAFADLGTPITPHSAIEILTDEEAPRRERH